MSEKQGNQSNLEQNQTNPPLPMVVKVLIIGLFGGLFWSLLAYLAYLFHFTELSPNMVLTPWAVGDWKHHTLGNFIGIIFIGLLSILVAFLYYVIFRKSQEIWTGIIYGAVLFVLVFYLLNPIFPGLESVREFKKETIVTTICLYILFGAFIGYSISFELAEAKHENKGERASANK